MNTPRVLLCRCARAQALPDAVVQQVRQTLDRERVPYAAVDDLCALAARRDPLLRRMAESDRAWVLACQPRAVRWLFAAAGASLAEDHTRLLDLHSPPELEGLLASVADPARNDPPASADPPPAAAETWHAWFPVIDFDRCTQCMQCLSFCLFGVFGVSSERRIRVDNPESCKPGCPACARVCPTAAIVFPKCPSPAMNGAEIGESKVSPEAMKVDISALLGGDVYQRLRARNQHVRERFSKERDPELALRERQQHLAELAREVPPEVLRSLPSREEMQRRAAAAQERARQALEERPTS